MSQRKKLIEVALPLDVINNHSAREKSIRHGHPSTLHIWWARRPLAACRAVLFASLVDDPGSDQERDELFGLIGDLVKWENINNEEVLKLAREKILKSTGGDPPAVLDPFCGGGSIPLEAQRLGLVACGCDLNPVAVLITKALIEIPPKFSERPPVNPEAKRKIMPGGGWRSAAGLAADVAYYGRWMRQEAEKRIGHLYPKGPNGEMVIAWLWARTVRCPNPACGVQMPLVRSLWLSRKKNKQVWVEPVVDLEAKTVRFEIRSGKGGPSEGTVNRRGARCIVCGTPVPFDHVRSEGQSGRMGRQLMAIVVEGNGGRNYLAPLEDHIRIAEDVSPEWRPEVELPHNPRDFKTPNYGMKTFADLFTPRQLVALTTFSDLVCVAREKVLGDATAAGLPDDGVPLCEGGTGATAYADAVATYLALAVDRLANRSSTICIWNTIREEIEQTFARQAIPMTWDFAEGNPFSDSTGNWLGCINWIQQVIASLPANTHGEARQLDATSSIASFNSLVISTDPPYYDNIGYADLSDFFYIWLRRSLDEIYPDLFRTMLTPKEPELVATPYRFGGNKKAAEEHFRNGLRKAFRLMRQRANNDYPFTIYYAFKQSEKEENGDGEQPAVTSTGWETMLSSLIESGFQVTGTWPMRTERTGGLRDYNQNALASSIVLVCRPRPDDASIITRREFLSTLRRELPEALKELQKCHIAPVDMAQASIGPGMAIFSRNKAVLEADGTPMSVRSALALINQALDEYLAEQEGEYDSETRWALTWFEQNGMEEGEFGDAETLCKARNTSIDRLKEAGIVTARGGKVKLLAREDYPADWNPKTDEKITVWKVMQYLIRFLHEKGEMAAAELLHSTRGAGETARDLAYRLYNICERKGWAGEALAYNGLVVAWPRLVSIKPQKDGQQTFDFGGNE
jgi:putative DNA methylase